VAAFLAPGASAGSKASDCITGQLARRALALSPVSTWAVVHLGVVEVLLDAPHVANVAPLQSNPVNPLVTGRGCSDTAKTGKNSHLEKRTCKTRKRV